MESIVILFIVFFVTLLLGVPFAWSLVASCICSLTLTSGFPLMLIAQRMYTGGERYVLLAVFFFLLAGAIMQHGGISSRLVNFSKACVGHISGGLSIVVLLTCMMFAALSGSSVATTAAIGAMLYPELVKAKYPKGYASALPVAGGTLGIVIPPSIVFVVYGNVTGTSVSKLLISGIVPGVLGGLAMCVYAYFYAKRHGFDAGKEKFSFKRLAAATKDAIWALMMPVIILGGIYSGMFTPTESAAVAVVYGLFVATVIHKELTRAKFWDIVIDSVKGTANILLLIMAATIFGYAMTVYNVPTLFTNMMSSIITSKVSFLLFLNVLLIILGMLMDTGAIVLCASNLSDSNTLWHRPRTSRMHSCFQPRCRTSHSAFWKLPFCCGISNKSGYSYFGKKCHPVCIGTVCCCLRRFVHTGTCNVLTVIDVLKGDCKNEM